MKLDSVLTPFTNLGLQIFPTALVIFVSMTSFAQQLLPIQVGEPIVTDRGPHHNVWTKTVQEQLPDGTVAERTHSYTELASGANFWDGNAWLPSTSEIEIIHGNAVSRHGQIPV